MEKKKLERIVNLIREQMTTNSVVGKPGFSSKADAEGPTAGFDPLVGKKKKRKPTPLGRYRTRVTWMKKDGE
jgi:hypothetical protein